MSCFSLSNRPYQCQSPNLLFAHFFMEMYSANTKEFILYFLLFFSFESHGSTPSQSNLNAILTMYPYVSTKFDFQTQSNPLHFVAHLLLWEHFFIIALSLTLPLSPSLYTVVVVVAGCCSSLTDLHTLSRLFVFALPRSLTFLSLLMRAICNCQTHAHYPLSLEFVLALLLFVLVTVSNCNEGYTLFCI